MRKHVQTIVTVTRQTLQATRGHCARIAAEARQRARGMHTHYTLISGAYGVAAAIEYREAWLLMAIYVVISGIYLHLAFKR